MGDDRLWITPIVRMEILYSARSTSEYTAVETELDGFRILRNDRAVADAAMSAVGELAKHSDGYHRVPLIDALIAEPLLNTVALRCSIATPTSTSSPKSSHSRTSSFQSPDLFYAAPGRSRSLKRRGDVRRSGGQVHESSLHTDLGTWWVTPQQVVRTRWSALRGVRVGFGLRPRQRIRRAGSTRRWER
jgi:hypothetical protein